MSNKSEPVLGLPTGTSSPLYSFESVEGYTQYIVGKVLTVLDASISDARQNKAAKDLLRDTIFNEAFGLMRDFFFTPPSDERGGRLSQPFTNQVR